MQIFVNKSNTTQKYIKILSILVCNAFLWNQLVFASGAEIPLQIKSDQEYMATIQGYAPEVIQHQETVKNNLINTRNSIENYIKNSEINAQTSLDPIETYYSDVNGRLMEKEVFNETIEGDFSGKHVKYHFLNEDWSKGHGKISKIDVYASEQDSSLQTIYDITYAASEDFIISKIKVTDCITNTVLAEYDFYDESTTNRIKSISFNSPDLIGIIKYEYYDENWEDLGFGRLMTSTLETVNSEGEILFSYEYKEDTDTILSIKTFSDHEARSQKSEYTYDFDGRLISIKKYSYEEETGNLERCSIFDSIGAITYDNKGRIIRIDDGAYVEERDYVLLGEEIAYTLIIVDSIIVNIVDGYCSDTAVISKNIGPLNKQSVSVEYDNSITVSYVDNIINSISLDDNYTNYYLGESCVSQNNNRGDFYVFEDNYLSKIATKTGNIYSFSHTMTDEGIIVSISESIVDGVKFLFDGAKPTIKCDSGGDNIISEIVLNTDNSIDTLKIIESGVERIVSNSESLFFQINDLLDILSTDVPNLEFVYGNNGEVLNILTSNHSRIFLADNLVEKVMRSDGRELIYEYIIEDEEIIGLNMREEGVLRRFDPSGNLLWIEFLEDEVAKKITFQNGELNAIESSDSILTDVDFDVDGDIESAHLMKSDGSEYFFSGTSLESFTNSNNVHYELSADGKISHLTMINTGESFICQNTLDPTDDKDIQTFTSITSQTQYVFKENLLWKIIDNSGICIKYTYYTDGRTKEIKVFQGDQNTSTYTYEYDDVVSIITDDIGNKRYYDENNRPEKLETVYKETYMYGYDTDTEGNPITIVNYSYKEKDDGTVIEYIKGQINKIVRPDGSWIDNVVIDHKKNNLKSFSLHTVDGKHHNVIIDGDLIEFEMQDSTRLIFYENKLVALGGSQGLVPLCDLDVLEEIENARVESEAFQYDVSGINVSDSNWRHQTYKDSQAIRFVEKDYAKDQWEVSLDLKTGDEVFSKGEMFLDLRYDIPGLEWQAPIDMEGETISFLFKLDDAFDYDQNFPCNIQVFAKDNDWNTQYGTEVSMAQSGEWIEVSLVPTKDNINRGYTDFGFDPGSIIMLGVRITQSENVLPGEEYLGKVYLKHNIMPDLFKNINRDKSPLDDLYYELGLSRDLDKLTGEGEVLDDEMYLEYFANALADGPEMQFQQSMLEGVNWHIESEDETIKAIESVYKGIGSDEWVMNVNLQEQSSTQNEGEIYFDVRSDVPGLFWNEPMNLTSRSLCMLMEIPEAMLGSPSNPNGARLFVEDANENMQYGTWVNLKESEKWYCLELTPTFGGVPMGYTDEGFDPSKIVKIGISLAAPKGSGTNFQGDVNLRFLPGEVEQETTDFLNMPLWMDMRGIHEYLLDEAGNYIKVPHVTYLQEEYYKYVFNRGTGTESLLNFAALEDSSTYWKDNGLESIGWNQLQDTLIANIDIGIRRTQAEGYLDVRYNCYVPDMNWSNGKSIDLTTQEIVFYVRTSKDFNSTTNEPLYLEAFVKDATWKTEYSIKQEFQIGGEWTKVTLTPLPIDFNYGYVNRNFDPTRINAIGFRVSSKFNAGVYTGDLEIKYEVNSLDLGVTDIADLDMIPQTPVWVNQNELAGYLIDEGIDLFGDFSIMADINQIRSRILEYELPDNFIAFTVYDENEKVEYITKPDGTTTYFDDNNCIDYIAYENGEIFVDYEYDVNNNLTEAKLVYARNSLDSAISGAIYEVDKKTTDVLLVLAEQQMLLEENYMKDVMVVRQQYASNIASLRAQRFVKVKHGWWIFSWEETVEVPGVAQQIAQLQAQEAEFNRQVAEELARLDAQIRQRKDEIDIERQKVIEEYLWQEKKMFINILREETISIIYYYYRSTLGRDASNEEITAIFDRINSNNNFMGFFNEDIELLSEIIQSLKMEMDSPIYSVLSDETKELIEGYQYQTEFTDENYVVIGNDLDELIRVYDLYDKLVGYYGSESSLNSKLSASTITCINSVSCLGKSKVLLTEAEKIEIKWMNRYLLQDLVPGIKKVQKDKVLFTSSILKNELEEIIEHQDRILFKETIITEVNSFLNEYLNNPDARTTFLAELGLTLSDVIEISDEYITGVINWLDQQNLHFGLSAFGTLYKMLEEKGVQIEIKEVTKEALLIDLLIGASGPMIDKDIEISIFTMAKVADIHGIRTNTVRLKYDDILNINDAFITLISGHHYVMVLLATETAVTYWDRNIGTFGGEVTITREEFEDNWQGNVIANEETLTDLSTLRESEEIRHLTAIESKKIKGAFFGVIFGIITWVISTAIVAITVAVQAVMTVIGGLILAIGELATGIMSGNIIAGLTGFVSNLAGAILESVIQVGSMLWVGGKAIGGYLVESITGGFISGIVGEKAVSTIVQIGVGYAASVGLEAIGVDPMVSNLIASAITGGVGGLLSGSSNLLFSAFTSALQWTSASATSMLGQYLDLDPIITSILSMTTFVMTGAAIDPTVTFGQAIKSLAKNLPEELAYYGVQIASTAMGMDPNISCLAGIAIRSSLRAGFSDGQDPGQLIGTALLQGVTSVGLNYLVEKMDVNPLLANIGFSAIAGAIEGAISGEGIFEHMFEMYEKNALAFFGGGTSSDPWQQAAYIAQIQDFTQIARERGFVEALNTYATGFFNSTAVNSIVTTGLTIGDYFKNKWDLGQTEQITLKDGQTVDGVRAENTESILLFDSEGNIIGLKEGENLIFGDIGVDGQGKMALLNGYIAGEYIPSLGITMDIEDGYATNARIIDPITGDTLYWLYPKSDGGYLGFDNLETLNDFRIQKIANTEVDFDISFDGDIYEVRDKMYFDDLSEENKSRLISLGLTDVDSLGYFAYELTPEEQLSRVAFSMELNDDIKNFITLYPELAPEVLDVFMEETIKVPYYDVLNKEGMKALTADYCGDRKIDLSGFRTFSALRQGLIDKYGVDDGQVRYDEMRILSERIADFDKIAVTANVLIGTTVQVYTDDGMLLEVSASAGEHFKSEESWQFFDEDKKLVDVEFNIKNGTSVEASISKKMLHSFVETNISLSGETSSKAGTYQLFSNVNLETTTSQFYGTNEHGAYIGSAFGELSVAGHQLTQNETLLYVDEEVLSGERVPVNNNEIYGKLVYDILNNEKDVITQAEYSLLQEKALEFTTKAFEGVEGVTVDDIAQLADTQVNRLSSIVSTGDFEITGISQDTVYNIYERLLLSEGVQGVNSATE